MIKPKEEKAVEIVRPTKDEKSMIITTDGKDINLQFNNLNALEVEMMLMKSLAAVRGKREEKKDANN